MIAVEKDYISEHDPALLAALIGADADRQRAVALRTRRAVYNAVAAKRADRTAGRRNLLIALLVTGTLTLAMIPALWAGMDNLLGGEALLDWPSMLVMFGITLCAAVAAVLCLLGHEGLRR